MAGGASTGGQLVGLLLMLPCIARGLRAPAVRGAHVRTSFAPPRRSAAAVMLADVVGDPAAVLEPMVRGAADGFPEHSAVGFFWNWLLLVLSGIYASVKNGPAIEAKRYADAARRGRRRARQPALPPVRERPEPLRRRREPVGPRGGRSAEDQLLDTFRW